MDLNQDGAVTSSEIKRIIESRGFYVSNKEAEQVLKKFDGNRDIHFTEMEIYIEEIGRWVCICIYSCTVRRYVYSYINHVLAI